MNTVQNSRPTVGRHALERTNVRTGSLEHLATAPETIVSWWADKSPLTRVQEYAILQPNGLWFVIGEGHVTQTDLLARIGAAEITVSRPVTDVAREVLAQVADRAIRQDRDAVLVRRLVLENIGAEFGVQS